MKRISLALGLFSVAGAVLLPQPVWARNHHHWHSRGVFATAGPVCDLPFSSHGLLVKPFAQTVIVAPRSFLVTPIDRSFVVTPFPGTVIVNQVPFFVVRRTPTLIVLSGAFVESDPVWVHGFWHWTGTERVWVPDQWLRPGHLLGFWRWSGSGWTWVPGGVALAGQ